MGQGALFDGWEATGLEINLGFIPGKGSGWLHVSTHDELKRTLTHRTASWRKERDLADVGEVLKGLAHWWLYGTPESVTESVPQLLTIHCPPIAPAADRQR